MAHQGKRLVIGVDGGGTKTHGILYVEGGETLAEGHFPSSNPHSNPKEKVVSALHGLVDDLLKKGDVKLEDVDGICMGMAGCDRPSDREFLDNIMRDRIGPETRLEIVNDAVIAMVAVLGKLHGILVIAGTGSICLGYHENKEGRRRCGGWGHLLADEGSGYRIGLMALQALLHVYDGRLQETSLTNRILEDQNLRSPTELVHWTYMSSNGKPEIAALARFVHEEAQKGDAVARDILEKEAGELIELIRPVYKDLFDGEEAPLGLWGGNIVNSKIYQDLFLEKLNASDMSVVPVLKEAQAVEGAALYMLQNL